MRPLQILVLGFVPKVSFSESLTSKAVAAILQRQGGHPGATGSSHFDKQVISLFRGPRLVSVPPCPHIGGRFWRLLVMLEQCVY